VFTNDTDVPTVSLFTINLLIELLPLIFNATVEVIVVPEANIKPSVFTAVPVRVKVPVVNDAAIVGLPDPVVLTVPYVTDVPGVIVGLAPFIVMVDDANDVEYPEPLIVKLAATVIPDAPNVKDLVTVPVTDKVPVVIVCPFVSKVPAVSDIVVVVPIL
jgi:hypothetical protein